MNIIVNGAAGRMGQQVCRLVEAEGHTLAAAVDRSGGEGFVSSLESTPVPRTWSSTFPTTPAWGSW